jgi:aryl-alcohol dehydrogenase-like predicted oxidoreductase
MLKRPFGVSGLQAPVLGFGAMQVGDPSLDDARAERVLHHVLDAGLTLIDTARSYGVAEERIGRILGGRRDEFVLSTKVGYGVHGIPDWTYDCVVAGVDAARDRLRTDVIDVVHLHSCPLETLQRGDVAAALARCRDDGKLRVAAYSGDGAALAWAVRDGNVFGAVQASVNLCDQQALPVLQEARARGLGTIAKRSLAGRPWAGPASGDPVHDEYRRRFGQLRGDLDAGDWDECALRFAAYADGVDCVIVGGTDRDHVDRNLAAIRRGPLRPEQRAAVARAFTAHGRDWEGLV